MTDRARSVLEGQRRAPLGVHWPAVVSLSARRQSGLGASALVRAQKRPRSPGHTDPSTHVRHSFISKSLMTGIPNDYLMVARPDDIAHAIRHARPGRFIVEEVSPAGQLLAFGHSCPRWGAAVGHPDGRVTLESRPIAMLRLHRPTLAALARSQRISSCSAYFSVFFVSDAEPLQGRGKMHMMLPVMYPGSLATRAKSRQP